MASSTQSDKQEVQHNVEAGAESQTSAASPAKATDQVFNARCELINGIGDAALKALLDGLQKPTSDMGPVITDRERNEVLQKHSVTEDQVTCLVDMVRKKGELACERFLSFLKEVEPGVYDQHPMILKLKEWIYSQYKTVQEYNYVPGQDVLLTDRYTDLLIVQQHRKQEEKEEEIRFRGASLFSAREAYQSTTVDQFFSPNDRGDIPKAVILQGHSGHGKSFMAQKIMLDWASGNLFQDEFELILHLKCKELNQVSGEWCVVDLVSCDNTFTSLISQKLKDSPQKVLFLIDGFDELRFTMSEINFSSVKDPFTPAPVEAILMALLKGTLLSDCFLVVTTRPTAAGTLSKLLKPPLRSTETLGFSEKGVQDYFKRFCQDQQVSDKAFSSVKATGTLFSSCTIPVICWIVCTVFREQLKENVQMAELETTTSIFVHFVSTLLEHHCQGLSQPVPTLLRSLGQLAERGMLEQQVLFDKESVLSTVSDPASVPFLCKFLLKKKARLEEMFSFMHLSFQEFFTALYYASDQNKEKVKELLGSFKEYDDKSYVLPVIQFLFGLSNKEVIQDLKKLKLPSTPSIRGQLEKWILELIKKNRHSKKSNELLFILHCLYELHEEEFVRRAMEVWGKIAFNSIPLTTTDCSVLLYCLQRYPTIRSLELTKCNITAEKLKMLQPALSRCEELGLNVEKLLDADVNDLVSALGEGKILNNLRVLNSSLSEESVQQVLSALYRQKSVGLVLLSVKTISITTAERLLQFYKTTQIREYVGVCLTKGADTADSLCSTLTMGRDEEYFGLMMIHSGDSSPESESSGLGLVLQFTSQISDIILREILHRFHQLRRFTDKSLEHNECVDALLSWLPSLPDLKRVILCVSCLTEIWATRILQLIHTCPNLERVQVQILEGADTAESLCSALLMKREEGDFSLNILHSGDSSSESESSGLGLHLHFPSQISDITLREILHRFHQLRRFTDNSLEHNECVDALLSWLPSLPYLKLVILQVSCLTEIWATRILQLIHTCPNLEGVQVQLLEGADTAESLCSALTMNRVGGDFSLNILHSGDSSPESESSGLRLVLHFPSQISDIILRKILHRFHQLRRFTDKSLEYNECLDALLSWLPSLPDLKWVILQVSCLTEIWATRILQLIHTCPNLERVQVQLRKGADTADSLCSALTMNRVEEYYSLMIAHSGDSSPESESSGLGLQLWFPSQISDIILREILHRFHQLRRFTDKSLEHNVDALLSWLASLPDLKGMDLQVSCLTEIWAIRILQLIHTCPSLERVQFLATVYDESLKEEKGLLLEEGIRLLQEAQRRPDCTITLIGKRCCKATVKCTEFKDRNLSCNKLRTITIEGEHAAAVRLNQQRKTQECIFM
ncbi:NACHT, LRR and PYD domains-containing protein 1 homolog isoform X2 [Sardina pilchardus]|uniref:NACHT, LRR and PYD domains-containing protein 1 homolog isoform X2 n=1 Tax=Sardina pilchardus TaxID=27697 RepID=UPI002E1277EE